MHTLTTASARRVLLVLAGGALVTVGSAGAAVAAAQPLLSDSFANATTSAPVTGLTASSGSTGYPCLTAGSDVSSTPLPGCQSPALDQPGSGVLRLTDASNSQGSGLLYTGTSLPTANGLSVSFTTYQYGGNGADGISFDLAVAPPAPTTIGAVGGGLGYTPARSTSAPDPGLPGGYLGIGFDAYGNYAAAGGSDCPSQAFSPETISVHGPGHGTSGYCLISEAQGGSDFLRSYDRASSARGFRIDVDGSADTYTVLMDPTGGTNYSTVTSGPLPTSYDDPDGTQHDGIPPRLTFVFAASTGGQSDVHEISNVNAQTLSSSAPPLPVLGLAASDDTQQSTTPGGAFAYTLAGSVSSQGGDESSPATLHLTAPLPADITTSATPTGTAWDCSASSTVMVDCTYTATSSVAAGTALPPVRVPVLVDPAASSGTRTLQAMLLSDDATAPVTASDDVGVGAAAAPPAALPEAPAPVLLLLAGTGLAIVGASWRRSRRA